MEGVIADSDMVRVQVSRELIEVARKKLEKTSKYRVEQNKIGTVIGKKKKKAIIITWFDIHLLEFYICYHCVFILLSIVPSPYFSIIYSVLVTILYLSKTCYFSLRRLQILLTTH